MHPLEFAQKCRLAAPGLSERAGGQKHWQDLCQLLGEPAPTQAAKGVAAVHGWDWPLGGKEILARLLSLNTERPA